MRTQLNAQSFSLIFLLIIINIKNIIYQVPINEFFQVVLF